MNQDLLNNVTTPAVGKAAYSLVTLLQDQPPELQVQAVTAAFHIVCDVYGVSKRNELERTARLIADAVEQRVVEFDALIQYLEEEVRERRSRS